VPTAAEVIARGLRGAGVRRLFGLPGGGSNLDLIEAGRRAGLELSGQDVIVNVAGGFRISEPAADLVIDTVTRYAPNFKASVLGRRIYSPLDLERDFGLTRGDIFHGALTPDQIWSARPVLGHADYRAPVKGLYLCGAGTHPGGGVSGLPGHNAAREIIRDFRSGKLK